MKKRRGCIKWAVVGVLSLVALLLVALCPATFLYVRQRDAARAQFAPPTVVVTDPVPGVSVPMGGQLLVSATAVGADPITRAELWVDGELVETTESDEPAGTSPFYAHFDLLVSEGPQTLFVRAVNALGIIGQSLPVSVVGQPGPGETRGAVVVGPGQTLADVALTYGTEPQILQELNPDLGDEEPPEGTAVIVPLPPKEEPPPSVGPSVPPTVPGATPSPPAPPSTGPAPMPGTPPLKVIEPSPLPVGPGFIIAIFVPPKPPAAPSDLQAQVENCMIRLRWRDNATNEERYEVWITGPGLQSQLLATLQPAAGSEAWFEFPAPQPGDFNVWVEAVNFVGKQPSNIVSLYVGAECPNTVPTHLQVEALDMSVPGGYDRVYCYVSFEDAPEQRLPLDDSAFIQVQGGRGEIAVWAAGSRKLTVPIPQDGALDMAGECWGWSGQALDNLGPFSREFSSETWDGVKRLLQGSSYDIGVAIQALGSSDTRETYGYKDPTIPAPYDLREERVGSDTSLDPLAEWEWFWQRRLVWKWDGDQKKITGFTIYLDGKPYKTVSANSRSEVITLAAWCGTKPRWQVIAVAGAGESLPSVPLDFNLPDCPVYAEVQFKYIHIICAENYWFHWTCPNCETIWSWFYIVANGIQRRSYFDGVFTVGLSCGDHQISSIGKWTDPKADTMVMRITPSNPSVTVGSRFYYENPWGELAKYQYATRTITMPLEKWKTYDEEFKLWTKANGVYSYLVVRVRGYGTKATP